MNPLSCMVTWLCLVVILINLVSYCGAKHQFWMIHYGTSSCICPPNWSNTKCIHWCVSKILGNQDTHPKKSFCWTEMPRWQILPGVVFWDWPLRPICPLWWLQISVSKLWHRSTSLYQTTTSPVWTSALDALLKSIAKLVCCWQAKAWITFLYWWTQAFDHSIPPTTQLWFFCTSIFDWEGECSDWEGADSYTCSHTHHLYCLLLRLNIRRSNNLQFPPIPAPIQWAETQRTTTLPTNPPPSWFRKKFQWTFHNQKGLQLLQENLLPSLHQKKHHPLLL